MVRTTLILGLVLVVSLSSAAAKYVDVRDPARRERIVASLRESGQKGLDVALAAYDALHKQQAILQEAILRHESDDKFGDPSYGKGPKAAATEDRLASARQQLDEVSAQLEGWRTAIDEIGSQRGCNVSRLYWHTDLADARATAERTGRPILSLRMLGKLTDEYSCANSRFFRTALYSNKEISDYLRKNYVLHWRSVRPVPHVTIDFGDGRKLERTLTGNSAHYVLASSGEPLDVLPGLYAPQAFEQWLARMYKFHGQYIATESNQRSARLAEFHSQRREQVYRQWADDIRQLGETEVALVTARINRAIEVAEKEHSQSPLAVAANRLSYAKMQAETPLLRYAYFSGPWIETAMDDSLWRAIATRHREKVQLDAASVAVMRAEFPNAAAAGRIAVTKSRQEDPLLRVVRSFEDSMTLDTVRNEYLLHRRVHEQFAEAAAAPDVAAVVANVETLNEWVYDSLFLTPSSDPWLGLAPHDVYTALDNDGRSEPAATVAIRSGG